MPDMGIQYLKPTKQLAKMFCVAERNAIGSPDRRARQIGAFADRLLEFTTDYINAQREATEQFVQTKSSCCTPRIGS